MATKITATMAVKNVTKGGMPVFTCVGDDGQALDRDQSLAESFYHNKQMWVDAGSPQRIKVEITPLPAA